MNKPNPVIYHNTKSDRRKAGTDLYPVYLRLGKKMFTLKIYLSIKDYKKCQSNRPGVLMETKIRLQELQAKAQRIIQRMEVYSYDRFLIQFKEGSSNRNNLLAFFSEKIAQLDEDKKYNTRDVYKGTLNIWKEFLGKKKLLVGDVTPKLLRRFSDYLDKSGRSRSTISLHLRNTRTMWNVAERWNPKLAHINPFKIGGFKIPGHTSREYVQNLLEVQAIFSDESFQDSSHELARDMWKFLFLCNGINIGDALRLKREALEKESVSIIRKKNDTKDNDSITWLWHPLALEIIEKWGTGRTYIFPDLENYRKPEEIHRRVKDRTSFYNRNLKKIQQNLKLQYPMTTNTARHSLASVLIEAGMTLKQLQGVLGHSKSTTTENYIKRISNKTEKRTLEVITGILPTKKGSPGQGQRATDE